MLDKNEFLEFSDTDQYKEVYARFGLCIFHFQVLEHQLLNMILIINKQMNIKMSDEEYNQIFYSYSDNTMGKLIEKVSTLFRFDEKIRAKLWDIHQKRNFYAHHYFKDRSTKWYTIEGRFEMIQEIDLVDMKTKELEENLVILAEPLVKSLGLTDEIIEKEFKKLKEGKLISDNLTFEKRDS